MRVAREAGWKTIVGGPEPGAYVREYLEAGADVVVIGEGEITMEELLPALRDKFRSRSGESHGIAFLGEDGSVVQTAPREQIADLDAQPWPARDAIDVTRYVRTWRDAHGQGSLSFITARGCPYQCRWCSHQVFGMTHRRRKPIAVVDEVEWLLSTYQPDMVWIADDVFTIHHGWLRQYAAEMRRRGLRIPFECISRADRLNPEVADLLAELGCFRVWIGSESGSQRILDAMERGVTVEQVQTAVAACKTHGIQSGHVPDVGLRRRRVAGHRSDHRAREALRSGYFLHDGRVSDQGNAVLPARGGFAGAAQAVGGDLRSRIDDARTGGRRASTSLRTSLLRDEVQLARLQRGVAQDSAEQELRMRIQTAREGLYSSIRRWARDAVRRNGFAGSDGRVRSNGGVVRRDLHGFGDWSGAAQRGVESAEAYISRGRPGAGAELRHR